MNRSLSHDTYMIPGLWISMLLWGFSWVSNKVLASYGPTEHIVLYRILLTCLSMAMLMPLLKEGFSYPKKGFGVVIGGALAMTLYFYLFIGGLQKGMPGAAGVLVTTLNPVVTYALTLAINRVKPSRQEAIGLMLGGIAGVFLLQLWNKWAQVFSQGNAYFLAATLVWAVLSRFTAASKNYGSSTAFSFWMYAISSVLCLLMVDAQESVQLLLNTDTKFWLNLFFSATIVTTLATTFYFIATAQIGVNKSSGFLFLVPSAAMLGAWIFIGEVPQWHTVVGGALGVLAVYVLNRKP